MEGGSTWSRETLQRLARLLHVEISRQITPKTEELMAEAERAQSADIDYRKVRRDVAAKLAQPWQCPARHAVMPLELRLELKSKHEMLRVFPNQDGAPTPYLPVRMFLCGVCQEVYREREIEVPDAQTV